MYPEGPTLTDEIIALIAQNAADKGQIIRDLIDEHDTSEMQEGVHYYFLDNDIKKRRKTYIDKDGREVDDPSRANYQIAHGWHKVLVDQKTSYLVGNPVVVSTEDEKYSEWLNNHLGEHFNDTLTELVKNSSNKGKEWLHVFIDEQGEFDYVIIPAEQIIPLYDLNKPRPTLEALIRYYPVHHSGDEELLRVEWWDRDTVTYYIQSGSTFVIDDAYTDDIDEETGSSPHFKYNNDGYGWGQIPFVLFKNNEEEVSDIRFYKDLIDDYDRLTSDASNNLDEIQSLILILKGYEGTDLNEFVHNLKTKKVIKVAADQGAGVDALTAEIPVNALDHKLNRSEQDIIAFGMGVNPKQDAFGANPTGVSLKFLYSLLDMKASALERKFSLALKEFVWFIKFYRQIKDNVTTDKAITFTFNKTMIFNETEQIDNAIKSGAIISAETATTNHPWVDNYQQEQERLSREREAQDPYANPGGG